MKINVSAGHGPDGKKACGAVGLIKESTQARIVTEKVIKLLRVAGHTVYDCTVNDGTNAADVLTKIVTKCNSHAVDLNVSIHFNSGRKDSKGDGSNGGTEVLVYDLGSGAKEYAERISKAISALGFRDRGIKSRKDLYFLRKTNAPALLIECCFVDDADDVRLYNADKMAQAIVKGITGKTVVINDTVLKDEFLVKVKVNALNIRLGAGTNYDIVGCIRDKGTYTIVKTKGNWGLLKSYEAKSNGWINISGTYVDRIN